MDIVELLTVCPTLVPMLYGTPGVFDGDEMDAWVVAAVLKMKLESPDRSHG